MQEVTENRSIRVKIKIIRTHIKQCEHRRKGYTNSYVSLRNNYENYYERGAFNTFNSKP
jgi:hypothetical protein